MKCEVRYGGLILEDDERWTLHLVPECEPERKAIEQFCAKGIYLSRVSVESVSYSPIREDVNKTDMPVIAVDITSERKE